MSTTQLAEPRVSRRRRKPMPATTRPVHPAPAARPSPQPRRKRADVVATLLAGGAVLGVYLLTLAPTVTSEDSGELITAAYGFGVAHPPGYPLWCLVAGFFASLAPDGAVAYAVNLSSALFGAATAALATATLLYLGCRRSAAFLAGVCLGVSKELWAQSIIAEVYSMNLFFVAVLVLVLLAWQRTRDVRLLVLFSGLLGLAMGNHHTVLAIGAVGLVWVLALAPRLVLLPRLVLGVTGAFLAGLSIYLYPVVSSTFRCSQGRSFRGIMRVIATCSMPERRASWTMLRNFGRGGNRCWRCSAKNSRWVVGHGSRSG